MKILYVINSGIYGGVERQVYDLAKIFSQNNKIYIWCADGPLLNWYSRLSVHITTTKIRADLDPVYIYKLYRFLVDQQIDVVHAHELKAGSNALIAAVIAGVKVKITHVHTPLSEWPVASVFKYIFRRMSIYWYKTLVNIFSTFEIALTESIYATKLKEGIKDEKLRIIGNIVDDKFYDLPFAESRNKSPELLKKFGLSSDTFVIGTVGRITQEKGQDLMIEAFDKILKSKKSEKKIHLMLIGGGQLEEEYRAYVQKLGIENTVSITGVFDDEAKIDYMSLLDVFCFPSRAEGFGLVMLEAMLLGLPVIAADLPVLRDVGSSDVYYFKPNDSSSLADVFSHILDKSGNELREIGMKLRKHSLSTHNREKFVQNYSSLYESFNAG